MLWHTNPQKGSQVSGVEYTFRLQGNQIKRILLCSAREVAVEFAELARRIVMKRPLTILTGAGISAESGIPTFRGPTGYWSQFKFEELASREGFVANPERVLAWYTERRVQLRTVQPNAGHYAIAGFERLLPETVVITQNVDGLHHRAGSQTVWELHGTLMRDKCFDCESPFDATYDITTIAEQRCPCGGRIRPDVVWFGELLPERVVAAAENAVARGGCCIVAGTQGTVWPAAGLAYQARNAGAFLIEVNPDETDLSPICHFCIRQQSGEALPKLRDAVSAALAEAVR